MSSIAGRLMIPAVISMAGVIMTQMWYMKASKVSFAKASGAPIAVLQQRKNQVERRPTTRLIWQDLDQGEPLYPGEAVRTTSTASGRIQFLQSGVTIGLEPDSVVIIEEIAGKVALNLINGGVFVRQDSSSSDASKKSNDQPVIKAGTKTISLTDKKSEMNLSMNDTGQASLVVSKGNVTIQGTAGVKSETVKEGSTTALAAKADAPKSIDILSPLANSIITISSNSSAMPIKWRPLDRGLVVAIEMGATRDKLLPVGAPVPGNTGILTTNARSGGFFWRLIAKNSSGKIAASSPTIYNEGLALEPPRLLSNASGERLYWDAKEPDAQVKLAWSHPQGSEQTTISIAKDREFKSLVEAKSFTAATEWLFVTKNPGTYYWKANVSWRGVSHTVPSSIGTFIVDRQKDLPTPTLDAPKDGSVFLRPQIEASGIVLSWNAPAGIDLFLISIAGLQKDNSWKDVRTIESSVNQYRLNEMTAGTWRWSVTSKTDARTSKPTAWSTFKVLDISRLSSSDITSHPQIIGANNILRLKVGDIPKATARIRFHVSDDKDQATPSWQQGLKDGQLVFKVKAPGTYTLNAEALDTADRILANTGEVHFEAKLPNTLAAPVLANKATRVDATERGDVDLRWTKVEGAVKYVVTISGGKLNYRKELPTTALKVANLPPGAHKLVITAVDKLNRPGQPSSEFPLLVPDVSNIAAPTSRGIKVRD